MPLTITLSKENNIYPKQERADIITNTDLIPKGKIYMIISDISSDSNLFSISVNLLSKSGHNQFRSTIGYQYLETKENREINLRYTDTETFDYFYIVLNQATIESSQQVTLTIDFR